MIRWWRRRIEQRRGDPRLCELCVTAGRRVWCFAILAGMLREQRGLFMAYWLWATGGIDPLWARQVMLDFADTIKRRLS